MLNSSDYKHARRLGRLVINKPGGWLPRRKKNDKHSLEGRKPRVHTFNTAWDIPRMSLRDAWYIIEIHIRYVWGQPEIKLRYTKDLPETLEIHLIYQRYTWCISPEYTWDLIKVCLEYTCDISEIYLWYTWYTLEVS